MISAWLDERFTAKSWTGLGFLDLELSLLELSRPLHRIRDEVNISKGTPINCKDCRTLLTAMDGMGLVGGLCRHYRG